MKFNLILASLALFYLAPCGSTQVYTPQSLQADLKLALHVGNQAYTGSVTVSQILSAGLAPRKKARVSLKPLEMANLRKKLMATPRRKTAIPARRGSAIRPRDLAGLAQPTVGPAPMVDLVQASRKFQAICARLTCHLTKNDGPAENLRLSLGAFLQNRGNQGQRWTLASMVELICAVDGLQKTPSVQQLKRLVPALRKESRRAMGKVNWGFSQIMAKTPAARTALRAYTKKANKSLPRAKRAKAKRPTPRGQMVSAKSARGLLSNILNDVADNLQEDFDQGCQYGGTAAQVIGIASGVQGAYAGIAANPTVHGAVQAVTGFATDTFNPMDPSEAIGHYAGGVVGMVGGAIGTAAGWICGTIESHMANRRNLPRKRASGMGKGKPQAAPVKLF